MSRCKAPGTICLVRFDDHGPGGRAGVLFARDGLGNGAVSGADAYTMWTSDGAPLGGVMKLPPDARQSAALAGVYLDARTSIETVQASRRSRRARAGAGDRHSDSRTIRRARRSARGRRLRSSRPRSRHPDTRARRSCASSRGTSSRPTTTRRRSGSTSGCSGGRRATPWTWARAGCTRCSAATASCSAACSTRRPRCPRLPAGCTTSSSTT